MGISHQTWEEATKHDPPPPTRDPSPISRRLFPPTKPTRRTSSLFSPTPSLCSMVSHKFGMRSDARTYNLSGMGCSAGVISLDLAKVCKLCVDYRAQVSSLSSTLLLRQEFGALFDFGLALDSRFLEFLYALPFVRHVDGRWLFFFLEKKSQQHGRNTSDTRETSRTDGL